ncbi:MAG: RIP metalloprotease RseP [Verrucomicrobiota bacterium]|jgi:regulator of sigma E protease|nr:RIP metalloprotease RseP [Verrucomicrobiota bacterium]
MMVVIYILAMLLLFSASIFVHELGHFLAARAFGMVVDVFSIGMGKAIWKKKVGATTYKIGWLPLGGYVALPQMDPNSFLEGTPDAAKETADAPERVLPRVAPWKKLCVSLAGAGGNIAFAFFLGAIVWLLGKPSSLQEQNGVIGYIALESPAWNLGVRFGDEIVSVNQQPVRNWMEIVEKVALAPTSPLMLGIRSAEDGSLREVAIEPEKTPGGIWVLPGLDGMDSAHVASVYPYSGAATAGIEVGDQLTGFNGQRIYSRAHLSQMVEANGTEPAWMDIQRGTQHVVVEVLAAYDGASQRHLIGVVFNTLADLDYGTLVHPSPWAQVKGHVTSMFRFLRALVTPSTSSAAAGAVGGPVMIFVMLWLMVKSSFALALWFTAFLNVNLAIVNLLPIPVLDGSHVVWNLWEWITGRPVPARMINALTNVFAALLLMLFLMLTCRDTQRSVIPSVKRLLSEDADLSVPPAVFVKPTAESESPE